jgi:hypothetical protein
MKFSIDRVSADYVYGWAHSGAGIKRVGVSVDGVAVGDAMIGLPRPDVGAAMPALQGSDRSGFLYNFATSDFGRAVCDIEIEIEDRVGSREIRQYARVPCVRFASGQPLNAPSAEGAGRSPLPTGVQALLAELDAGHQQPGPWTQAREDAAIADLIWLINNGSTGLAPLQHYLLYLNQMATSFDLISKRFPAVNTAITPTSKDMACVASSADEMLAISNHLYTLRSHGLDGAFTEFGCFKGFSSSCLSHACAALGIEHHIFDSFCGLPPSGSDYYAAGDFAGSLDEVKNNITAYGDIRCVRFFKGYFSDSLPSYQGTPLAIWMDVDLRSSAADVMQLLPQLPRKSLVFTHECRPEHFVGGQVVAGDSEDDVLPPILAAFAANGRIATGAYLSGYTGAVWDSSEGIPPLSVASIRSLIAASANPQRPDPGPTAKAPEFKNKLARLIQRVPAVRRRNAPATEKVTTHSRFGGLWIDRSDWREELNRRRMDRRIDDAIAEQIERFEQDGFLILPGAAPEKLVDAFQRRIDRAFFEGNEQVLYQQPGSNISEPLLGAVERLGTRVVDCFVPLPEALDLFTVAPLSKFLTAIFDAPPLLFQSLSFDQGSQQGLHQDTAYVVVDRPLELAACWIALQDVEQGSGELMYVPGTHRLPDWDFGGGKKHWDPGRDGEETHRQWSVMLAGLGEKSSPGMKYFYPKKGDILIWHADLAHGGAPVTNPSLRRQSLVGHFCPSTRRPRYFDHGPKREFTKKYRDIYFSSEHYDLAS